MLFSVLRFSWSSLLPFLAACIEKEEKKLENNFCICHFLNGGEKSEADGVVKVEKVA